VHSHYDTATSFSLVFTQHLDLHDYKFDPEADTNANPEANANVNN